MELTGKCKEEFEKWYLQNITELEIEIDSCYHSELDIEMFYKLPKSMRYGVYVDFFDSVGVVIDIDSEMVSENPFFDFTIDGKDGHNGDGKEYETRPEARAAAIEKANEIYNLNQ